MRFIGSFQSLNISHVELVSSIRFQCQKQLRGITTIFKYYFKYNFPLQCLTRTSTTHTCTHTQASLFETVFAQICFSQMVCLFTNWAFSRVCLYSCWWTNVWVWRDMSWMGEKCCSTLMRWVHCVRQGLKNTVCVAMLGEERVPHQCLHRIRNILWVQSVFNFSVFVCFSVCSCTYFFSGFVTPS